MVEMYAQSDTLSFNKHNYTAYKDYYIYEGDTLYIALDEVKLPTKLLFKTRDDKAYFYWLRRKVHKSYPYALLVQERMEIINENLKHIKSKKQKKVYLKRLESYFEEEFTGQLKKLTRTEGRLLIKLIHRQTGNTVYGMVKEYKSGWSAYWNNKTAKLFKLDLKDEYEPALDNEDYLVELILEKAQAQGTLKVRPTALKYEFDKIKVQNGKYVEIERRI
jgi:hypothetical protein